MSIKEKVETAVTRRILKSSRLRVEREDLIYLLRKAGVEVGDKAIFEHRVGDIRSAYARELFTEGGYLEVSWKEKTEEKTEEDAAEEESEGAEDGRT